MLNPAITGLALAQLLNTCAPDVGERTMHAIVTVETGGHPYEIGDNTDRRSYAPRSQTEAIAWANRLLARGHNIDLGLAQVNSANLPHLRLTVADAFDPCKNVGAASQVLMYAYREAVAQFGPGQYALRRALSAYNTGKLFAGAKYVARVLAASGLADDDGGFVPDLAPLRTPPAQFASQAFIAPQPVQRASPSISPQAAPTISPQTSPIMVVGNQPAVAPSPSPSPSSAPVPNAPVALKVTPPVTPTSGP
jgi:type IV secretion system protein VirB1